jgi:hypothetical protein
MTYMKDIEPVHLHNKGPRVHNLHKGLLFLIAHQDGMSDNDRRTLTQRLAPDLVTQTFGDVTAEIVGMWQYQFTHWPNYMPVIPKKLRNKLQNLPMPPSTGRGSGDVDAVTAEALNWLLRKLRPLQPE